MPNIQEFNPCDDCIRSRREYDFGTRSASAGTYLLFSAMEAAGLGEKIDDVTEQDAINFMHSRAPSGVAGAVRYCGRSIGNNACASWILDHETSEIVPREIT